MVATLRGDAAHCGTLPDARPGPVELKLASLGPVQPLAVGHYGEMGGYVDELLELAADADADKHWQSMRCRDPDTARGIILQVLRRSWGMAAFRENARLVVRRLIGAAQLVRDSGGVGALAFGSFRRG